MPADTIIVERSLPMERMDIFLREKFPAVSRGTIQRLIDEGHVLVNGKAVKPSHHPHVGETIDITWPEPKAAEALPEKMPLDILFEDDDLLVVNRTRVRPVRVLALRATGGAAEVLLLEPREDGLWLALVRPYRRLREGEPSV